MKYLSLFTGIGGFELGIQQAYESNIFIRNGKAEIKGTNTSQQGLEPTPKSDEHTGNSSDHIGRGNAGSILDIGQPECVGYSEIDKYACQIYLKHFPNHINYGDITKIKEEELPDFDLIVGGFPCQSFSIAGKRGGFEDTRGTLFFDIARILQAKQPRLLLLENVKGLLSHDNGNTFKVIISTLTELGYDLQWQVLNSKNHGVPQNRERVFIIGHLRGTTRPQVFPFTGECGKAQAVNQVGEINKGQSGRIYGTDGVSPTLNTMEKGGLKQPKIFQRPRGNNKGGRHDIAPTMTGESYKDNNHVDAIRRLTPTECERLQGFPDGWTDGVSDTQRYKTLGNAVTVNVIRDIMIHLLA